MTDVSLLDLASYVRPLAQQLLDLAKVKGVECRVVDTLRTPAEQQVKLAQKVSWTQNSKHLPQPPEGLSEAFDIVPLCVLALNRVDWAPADPAWLKIGLIGESLGLEWGGRWVGAERDPSHFQFVHTQNVHTQQEVPGAAKLSKA